MVVAESRGLSACFSISTTLVDLLTIPLAVTAIEEKVSENLATLPSLLSCLLDLLISPLLVSVSETANANFSLPILIHLNYINVNAITDTRTILNFI